jgi:nucleotide-binding universal stress UspA family protein
VGWISANMPWMEFHLPVVGGISWAQIGGAALVIIAGKIMVARAGAGEELEVEAAGAAARTGGHMLKVLVPVDGSNNCLRAVQSLIRQATLYKEPLEIHLLNVQHPFPGTVRGVHEQAEQHHQEEGAKALAGARTLLDEAGLKYTHHVAVGEIAEVVAHFVKDKQLDQVMMGTRGMSAAANMLLGSVASKILHLVEVPVLLVK